MADNDKPIEGDTYACKGCEMSILVTKNCDCEGGDGPFFACCGEAMEKQASSDD